MWWVGVCVCVCVCEQGVVTGDKDGLDAFVIVLLCFYQEICTGFVRM